jgi:16S rRNA (cytosine967-C5)-methyltransferase
MGCNPGPGERWWHACAGEGGKSLQLASLMAGKGTVVASDIRAYKLGDLRKRARRAGLPNIECRAWDGRRIPAKPGTFAGVLVDAPCTCSGTWRRNPAARWQVAEEEIGEMAERQFEIVRRTLAALRPGGILVYATCSLFAEENEANVQRIVDGTGLALEPFADPLSGRETDGTLRIVPWDGDCDGMFVARFRLKPAPGSCRQ